MEIIVSKVITNLYQEVYSLLELFDLKRRSYQLILRGIFSLEVKKSTFEGFKVEIINDWFIETGLSFLQGWFKNINKLKLAEKTAADALKCKLSKHSIFK